MLIHPTTELLTLDDLAGEARVVRSTIERWVYDLDLASFRKGGVRRVSRESWTKFVLLNTLNPRRPDWLTAAVESELRRQLREVVAAEVERQRSEDRGQKSDERIAA